MLLDPRRSGVAAALCGLLLCGCLTYAATGKKRPTPMAEKKEVSLGQEADRQTVASLGLYGSQELQAFVQRVGNKLAPKSERPGLTWTFRLVDDPAVNAFGLPGGFIYVTRGLMTYLNSEAELAAVLGHEIGHVVARHTSREIGRSWSVKFSRDDEREADELGLQYLVRAGYDPRPMTEVFSLLGNVCRLGGGGRLPDWLSTHPNPEDRKQRMGRQIIALGQGFDGATVERDRYLQRLDGMVFGENPREGYFEGNLFFHPDLKFRFELPEDWIVQGLRDLVKGASPDEGAAVQLTLSDKATPDAAVERFFAQQGLRRGRVWSEPTHGLPAVWAEFEPASEELPYRGLAMFIAYEGKVFQLVAIIGRGTWLEYLPTVKRTLSSFGPLTDPRALAVEPMRLQVVRLADDMSLEQFAKRYPSSVPLDRLAVINHLEARAQLKAGQTLKRVVLGKSPA